MIKENKNYFEKQNNIVKCLMFKIFVYVFNLEHVHSM